METLLFQQLTCWKDDTMIHYQKGFSVGPGPTENPDDET